MVRLNYTLTSLHVDNMGGTWSETGYGSALPLAASQVKTKLKNVKFMSKKLQIGQFLSCLTYLRFCHLEKDVAALKMCGTQDFFIILVPRIPNE